MYEAVLLDFKDSLKNCLSADDCTHSNCPRLATVIGAILKTSLIQWDSEDV